LIVPRFSKLKLSLKAINIVDQSVFSTFFINLIQTLIAQQDMNERITFVANSKNKSKNKNLPVGIQSTLSAKNKSVAKNIQVQFA